MPNISQEDLQTLVELPFNFMKAYYDRVEEKVVSVFDLDTYDWGAVDEDYEEAMKERAELYARETDRYEPIYELSSSDSFRVMAGFVDQLTNQKEKAILERVLNGSKPFRKFKDTVDDLDCRLDWFRYRDERRAEQFREEILASLGVEEEYDFEDDDEDDDDDFTFDHELEDGDLAALAGRDADAGLEGLSFEFEWLELVHGIKLTEEDVRNVPAEVIAYRESLTEEDLENPRQLLRRAEPVFEKHPNDPTMLIEMAGLYMLNGKELKGRRLMERVQRDFPDNFDFVLGGIMAQEDEDVFLEMVSELPAPLDIRNHPAGNDGYYHTLEFLNFEEMAIRTAIINDNIDEARQRLDRLVRFGFLHGDVEQSAVAIAAMQLSNISQGDPDPLSDVSDRTQAILEQSMIDAAEMFRQHREAQEQLATPVRRLEPKVGRNDPCPCGSGKKHKQCCLKK